MDVIECFKNGAWLNKAKKVLGNKQKIRELLIKVSEYISKEGLSSVRKELELLCSYVWDIVKGDYSDYDGFKLTLIIAALIYVVSPIDIIPDIIPVVGLVDDVAVIGWLIREVKSELDKYEQIKRGNNRV